MQYLNQYKEWQFSVAPAWSWNTSSVSAVMSIYKQRHTRKSYNRFYEQFCHQLRY